ncbi:protein ENHANCED DISEASE RESISTANCE 2-like isoform X1 [Salvia splendens]|uniref:protein ENHANCED DISEASE RESISTANCE 2-like isoform X1 n=1 Tax=Salvia splendens TaxID=180675 RepID=UPI001C27B7AA|nr:protein ENHANCED DISEASE RESISTANCE 2-like isoform X1 [Salvia splendens]
MASSPALNKVGGDASVAAESGSEEKSPPAKNSVKHNVYDTTIRSHSSGSGDRFEYSGWVFHLGVNKIGREYCHFRFLTIRGKYLEMYKRDPHENPGTKPIRRGVIGHTLMVEELGRRKVNNVDMYALRFYNRLDEAKKGEIACTTAGDARKWMEAFDHAKQVVEYELSRGASVRNKLSMEDEIDLEGHRPRVRHYAHGLKKLIRIGQGPEMLVRKASSLSGNNVETYYDADGGDAVEAHEWRCVRTVNGVRIFEDVASSTNVKGVLVKAVGVVDASADTVFEIVLNTDRQRRYEWDALTGDLELIDSINGHYDVVYGTFDPRYLTWWQSKRDFVFSRQWFRGQDGKYTILQFPSIHKNQPPRSGYERTKINPSTWEMSDLSTSSSANGARCLITQTLEINPKGWFKWRNKHCPKFEKTVPYALLSQVSGLKEYIGANPALASVFSTTIVHSKSSDLSGSNSEFEDAEGADEFYDATDDSSSDDDDNENDNKEEVNKDMKTKLRNISWAIAGLSAKRASEQESSVLNTLVSPINLDSDEFHGTMRRAKDELDKNCWSSPDGSGFMIRGKTYLKDGMKVKGGEPLLKLVAVDWFKVENCASKVALHPKSLAQSAAGKKLPFIFIINLEVPARPNYSLVLYYAADRPVIKSSLLGKFIDGTDMYRDSRFKLIPSITEGYWMVKRAVGTKACILGKAVTCNYLRQDNFLEIDVDIGSSSVARGVIGLVLGYVTSIVVDLAIVIEAKEESELPEFILETVRLNRVQLDTAVDLDQ